VVKISDLSEGKSMEKVSIHGDSHFFTGGFLQRFYITFTAHDVIPCALGFDGLTVGGFGIHGTQTLGEGLVENVFSLGTRNKRSYNVTLQSIGGPSYG